MITAVVINWNTPEISEESAKILLSEVDKVILIDNGSTLKPKRIKGVHHIYNDKNFGNSIARNQAIREAEGDIFLLDGDILYVKGTIALLKEKLVGDIGCAGLCPILCNEFDKENACKNSGKLERGSYNKLFDTWHGKIPIAYTQYGLFRKEVFETCMFDETGYFGIPGYGWEDNDLFLQMYQNGWHVAAYGGVKYFHDKSSSMRFLDQENTPKYIDERYQQLRKKWKLQEKTVNLLSCSLLED